jgi:hypothetical protein
MLEIPSGNFLAHLPYINVNRAAGSARRVTILDALLFKFM